LESPIFDEIHVKNDSHIGSTNAVFSGYSLPTSNTTYTPNQFFDLCLPYSSRGCVRLVSYMLRKTLGWSDSNGNPQEPITTISYSRLIRDAGISRGGISKAINEAIEKRFIKLIQKGIPASKGNKGQTALYELNWDETYKKNLTDFNGFYSGNGNLTYIPNQFFDHTVPNESLAVGFFDTDRGKKSIATTYGIKWAKANKKAENQERFKNRNGKNSSKNIVKAVQKPKPLKNTKQSKNHSQSSSKSIAKKQFKNHSPIKITPKIKNKTTALAVPGISSTSALSWKEDMDRTDKCTEDKNLGTSLAVVINLLVSNGFNSSTASYLAKTYSEEVIKNQCSWIDKRKANKNKLGLLRKAIEQNWESPIKNEHLKSQVKSKTKARKLYRSPTLRTPEMDDIKAQHKLKKLEKELQRNYPEKLKKFIEDEQKKIREIESMRMLGEETVEKLLKSFSSSRQKLERLSKIR